MFHQRLQASLCEWLTSAKVDKSFGEVKFSLSFRATTLANRFFMVRLGDLEPAYIAGILHVTDLFSVLAFFEVSFGCTIDFIFPTPVGWD